MPARRRPAITVLAILLVVWEPAAFAFYAAAIADRIVDRGPTAVFLLVVKLAVLGMGIAAGRALWRMSPGSVRFAQVALALSAATTLAIALSDAWPPRAPGELVPLTILVLLYDAAWILYLSFALDE
jgi:hypothetical protein